MTKLEKLVHQQSEHLAHLEKRIDELKAGADVLSAFVVSLLALVPAEEFVKPEFAKRMNAYMNAYVKMRAQGVSNLSEFPFVPSQPLDE